VAFGLRLHRVPAQDIDKRVQEAAAVLGLEPLLKRKPRRLSGGQRQRVALGRAIVRQADVFLMDEPLSNLDAQLRVATRAEIIKLHRLIRTTVIYVTHDQVEAMTMGDRIAVLNAGIIQQLGTPQQLYDLSASKADSYQANGDLAPTCLPSRLALNRSLSPASFPKSSLLKRFIAGLAQKAIRSSRLVAVA
jgi:ABC-type sugar transport system ATPase subunit